MELKKNNDPRIEKIRGSLKVLKNINLNLDAELLKKFKSKTAVNGVSMTEVLQSFIVKYLED